MNKRSPGGCYFFWGGGLNTTHLHGDLNKPSLRIPMKQSVLVGGFNPIETYQSNWTISPRRGEIENICNHHPVTIPMKSYEMISIIESIRPFLFCVAP